MSDGEINVDSIDGEVSTSANIIGQLYPQGEKGDTGEPGQDGFSPIVTTEKVGKTTTITITDAEGEHTATILDGADGQGSGDMRTEVYDVNQNGIVDNAEKVNNHTVGTDVPADAVFTDTTYTAGTGIDITGNVITNTQTSAEWGNITGTLSDQTDLKSALDDKADTSSLSSVATSGSYTDLSDKPSIPTNTSDLTNNSGFIDKDVNNLTNYDTSTAVDTKISNSEEVLIGSDSGIKASHEIWIDPNDVTPIVNSEISNDYGIAQNLGYSQEYFNTVRNSIDSDISTINDKLDGDKPMGDIVANSVQTKNLLNPDTIVNGSINATTGEFAYYTYALSSDYIPVKASTKYTIKLNNVTDNQFIFRIVQYNTSKMYMSTLVTNVQVTQQTFNIDMDGYVRICFGKGNWDSTVTGNDIKVANPQLEEGESSTTYTKHFNTQEENLKPYVLFSGDTIGAVLNDKVDNYEYIEIYGKESGSRYIYTKVEKGTTFINKKFILQGSFVVSTSLYIRGTVYQFGEHNITADTIYQSVAYSGGSITNTIESQTTSITKVVGWK